MAKAKKAKIDGDVAIVSYRGGTREFTREIHGDDFAALANEFATKHGGTIVGAEEATEEGVE